MNRTDRLYALREELRRAGEAGCTSQQLAERFEVSARTIKRDLLALQQGGFPVWAQPGPGGGYAVDAEATLPPVNFTDAEASGLAAAVAAHRGQPFDDDAQAALAKVLGVMDAGARDRAESLGERVWIDRTDTHGDPRVRRAVERALREWLVLSVHHRDRFGEEHAWRVDPILLARTQGAWFLVAQRRDRRKIEWIDLASVVSAHVTSEPAEVIPVEAVGAPPATAVATSWWAA